MSTITVESADVPLLEMSMSLILFELISQAIYIYDVAQSTTSDQWPLPVYGMALVT